MIFILERSPEAPTLPDPPPPPTSPLVCHGGEKVRETRWKVAETALMRDTEAERLRG